jgi:purine-binding chemotaxis protein CheW
MNLAEIRKKAQGKKEKTEEQAFLAPAVAEETVTIAGNAQEIPDPLPEEASTDLVLLTDVSADGAAEERMPLAPEADDLGKEDKKPRVFDPLAVLLAGRESVCLEEDQALSSAALQEISGTALQEFLCFRVATETYALSIMDIKEIIKPREVTEVPRVPEFVSGVLSLRGIIIPVFHMRHRLGLLPAGTSGKERIVVVKKAEDYCGLLVDEVVQVVKIATEGIEAPPAVLDGIDREFVAGIGRHDGQMLILLNLGKVLDVTLC